MNQNINKVFFLTIIYTTEQEHFWYDLDIDDSS